MDDKNGDGGDAFRNGLVNFILFYFLLVSIKSKFIIYFYYRGQRLFCTIVIVIVGTRQIKANSK